MKINWNYIKIISLLIIVAFLYSFSSKRNSKRKVTMPKIQFLEEQKPFITHKTVSKLLIQNHDSVTSMTKETLVLNDLEKKLNANKIIENAEVFITVKGDFIAKVKQKKPIARVINGAKNYYIDSNGGFMPLSKNYSARVPIITGSVDKSNLETVYKIASYVFNDKFLKTNVIEIQQNKDKTINLKLRQCKFIVQLGQLAYLEKKINNLKAFYKKAIKDKSLTKYSKVNLQFENQVVCTKV